MTEIRAPDEQAPTFSDPIAPVRAAIRGRYEILRQIGQGAFATVYLARDLKHERKVAIKILNADPTSETGELRFIREIRTVASLQHPNILPLHDSGHVEALLYYVMPFVDGETLRDRIDRERQLPFDAACTIAREAADALAYAHAQGIIHRDIKPENILLSAGHPIIADFGLARAIDLAGVRQLTNTGMGSPGTPAYMSPEQLLGDREIDGRSDLYSLGCVLYEMLTGKPPFAGKDGFVKRFTEPPPCARDANHDLPEWIDAALGKALARNRDDRYPSAQEFVRALSPPAPRDGASSSGPRASGLSGIHHARPVETIKGAGEPVDPPHAARPAKGEQSDGSASVRGSFGKFIETRSKAWLALGAVAILSAAAFALTPNSTKLRRFLAPAPPIDSTLFVILPFANQGDPSVGGAVAEKLYDAFMQWRDISVVPDTKVAQLAADRGSTARNEAEALSLARALGAGTLVWGQVSWQSGSARARVHLYDVRSRDSKNELVFADLAGDSSVYRAASLALLRLPNRPHAADGGDGLTNSYAAWSAYGQGHLALAKWNVAEAQRRFEAAIEADPDYAAAHLWLAQVIAWTHPETSTSWQDHAARAASAGDRLSGRDRLLADALVAMSAQSFPLACGKYKKLTLADSVDFIGWYGLGECQAFDSLVLPSRSSPSGWSFRSSNRGAATAYRRAVKLEPGARAIFRFEKLQALLPTAATKVRFGKGPPPQSPDFMASPSLAGSEDTLAFVPYPAALFSDKPLAATATLSAANTQNIEQLLDYSIQWTRDSKNDPAAFEALADVLDVRGDIGNDPSPTGSALSALRRARALSADPRQRLRTISKEAWLHLKRDEFADARKLADSALAARPQPSREDAEVLISLAALTGRADRMEQMTDMTGAAIPRSTPGVPGPVKAIASRLFTRAALGVCGSDITATRKELDDAIDHYVAPANAPSISRDILARPLSMLTPCTHGESVLEIQSPRDRTTRMQQAYARGQLKTLRSIGDTLALRIRMRRPGDLSPDFTFQQAWLRAAIGDTADAIAQLDRSLGALPGLSGSALQEAGSAAAMVRAMILRADLAQATGDARNAGVWAARVAVLWSNSDPLLQPQVARMRGLAAKSRAP